MLNSDEKEFFRNLDTGENVAMPPDNPSAFPRAAQNDPLISGADGMTLRDYFAAAALQGIMADHTVTLTKTDIVHLCWAMADEMIKQRNQQQPTKE